MPRLSGARSVDCREQEAWTASESSRHPIVWVSTDFDGHRGPTLDSQTCRNWDSHVHSNWINGCRKPGKKLGQSKARSLDSQMSQVVFADVHEVVGVRECSANPGLDGCPGVLPPYRLVVARDPKGHPFGSGVGRDAYLGFCWVLGFSSGLALSFCCFSIAAFSSSNIAEIEADCKLSGVVACAQLALPAE
jgi:hypothetical protein